MFKSFNGIDDSKPIEYLVGDNLAIVNLKVDKLHVATSWGDVAREVVKPVIKAMKDDPSFDREIRRGLVLAALSRHSDNRMTWNMVNPNQSLKTK